MSQVLSLFRLQTIDTQRDQILNRVQKIDAILMEDEVLRSAHATEQAAEKSLREANAEVKQAEDNVSSQKIKIELDEASLYGGKMRSPKELQDLQNEVESLKRYLSVLEERQLEAMLTFDEKEAAHSETLIALHSVESQQATSHASLLAEKEKLEHTLIHVDEERRVATNPIDQKSLALYERLRQEKRGLAVAQVEDSACMACGVELTPAECQLAKSPSQIRTCPSCGRILYAG